MDNFDTVLAVIASVVTIGGGIIGILQYLERAQWRKNRGRAGVVIGGIAAVVLLVLTGSTFAMLKQVKQQPPDPVGSACTRLPDFAKATSPALGDAFAGVAFLPASYSGGGNTFEVYNYQFEFMHVCTTSLKAANAAQEAVALRNYYTAQMPAQGWTQSASFPLDGNPAHPCGEEQDSVSSDTAAICWSQDSRFVSLQGITVVQDSTHADAPAAVTYYLWLSIVPQTSSGAVTISRNSLYAFEPQGVDAGDIQWLQRGNGVRTVGPVGNAIIVYVGAVNFTALPVSDLTGMSFGSHALGIGGGDGGTLAVGDVFGVLTTNHHYVKVEVLGAASDLRIRWVLYPYTLG